MQLRRIAPVAGAAVMVVVSSIAVATAGAVGTQAKVRSAACPLATAADPGNSTAPASIPVSRSAPKLAKKSSYRVAFSQNASNNPWRLAETASMKGEAKRLGIKLTVTDANNSQSKQIEDIKSLIAQKPDALFIAPITEQLANVVKQAGQAGIPVFLLDRDVDHKVAVPGKDYVTVIQSDFIREGDRAAVAAIDRKKGFDSAIQACPGLSILASQDGDFNRATGQKVAETLLQAHPDATAIYAHNDEMALGAIAALKALGKTPGKDVQIVSIDGEKDGLKAVAAGDLYTTVECNPRFGPKAFATMLAYASGKPVKVKIVNSDKIFSNANASANVAAAY